MNELLGRADFWLGILLKHSSRERFLMQHKLWWHFLQMVWQFRSFYFFLSSFRLNTGYWAVYAKWRKPKPSPAIIYLSNRHLICFWRLLQCSTVLQSYYFSPYIYINIKNTCFHPSTVLPHSQKCCWKQDRRAANCFTRPQEPTQKFTGAVLKISTRVRIGRHLGDGVIGCSSSLVLSMAKSCLSW